MHEDTFITYYTRYSISKLLEIANEHRRKAHKTAKSQGKQLNSRESELLGWNIIITNVPNDMLYAEAICDLYRARWQIELAFKSFKSHLNIDKVGICGQYQIECLIYGRLIAKIMIYSIYNALFQKKLPNFVLVNAYD